MLKYSVIIPVYNVKEYLSDCIDSVLAQSISDYEVILVNDGSTDGSGELCDQYSEKYPQIHTVHQQNQGVSVARNTGLEKATGEYVLFLDSDDWWEPNLLELLNPVTENRYDLVEFGFQIIYSDVHRKKKYPPLLSHGIRGKDHLQLLFQKLIMPSGSSCCSTYRRQFLLDQKLQFPVGIRYGEDLRFRLSVLDSAASVYTLQETPYCYRQRQTSVTHRISAQSFRDVLTITAEICRVYPLPVTANYYCVNLLAVASLTRKEAQKLKPLYRENQDLLRLTSGSRSRIIRLAFSMLGWYSGAKLILFCISVKQLLKGKD